MVLQGNSVAELNRWGYRTYKLMISHDLELILKKASSFFLIFTAGITQIPAGFSRSLLLICSPDKTFKMMMLLF